MRFYYWILRTFDWHEIKYQFKRKTVWAFHRVRHGWAAPDTWSFDNYLAKIIAEGCRHLQKNTHSYPSNLTEKKWDAILEQIAEGFEIYSGDEWWWGSDQKADKAKIDKAKKLFNKYFESLWD